jgi:uncharacterized protein
MFVIETTPEIMLKIMSRNKTIERILRNGWAKLAVLATDSNEIQVFASNEFHQYHPEKDSLPKVNSSTDWHRGSRIHLDFAQVEA